MNTKQDKRIRRHRRIRAKVKGTGEAPRLVVYRSNKYIYAQLVDDDKGATLAQSNSGEIGKGTTLEKAKEVGKTIAKKAKEKKIGKAVFDRAGFIYTGKVKAVAEGAREGGLKF
ncbi:MAG: 50S ribosomal protein L18 [Candidatus Taylorbacteria bacterium]